LLTPVRLPVPVPVPVLVLGRVREPVRVLLPVLGREALGLPGWLLVEF
jgi:hypothetical protein